MPSKKGRHEKILWSDLYTWSSVNVDTFSYTSVCMRCVHYFVLFFKPRIYRLHFPTTCHEDPFTSGLGTRSYRKSALRGTGRKRANEGTGKGTWKWKATFQASRCGEGPLATKDDRTLRASARAHCDRHVLFKVTGPPTPHSRPFAQRRPGALYWNSADRLSWLCESALSLFLSLLMTRPFNGCEDMFNCVCLAIKTFLFWRLFTSIEKNCNDVWLNNVGKWKVFLLEEHLYFRDAWIANFIFLNYLKYLQYNFTKSSNKSQT